LKALTVFRPKCFVSSGFRRRIRKKEVERYSSLSFSPIFKTVSEGESVKRRLKE